MTERKEKKSNNGLYIFLSIIAFLVISIFLLIPLKIKQIRFENAINEIQITNSIIIVSNYDQPSQEVSFNDIELFKYFLTDKNRIDYSPPKKNIHFNLEFPEIENLSCSIIFDEYKENIITNWIYKGKNMNTWTFHDPKNRTMLYIIKKYHETIIYQKS